MKPNHFKPIVATEAVIIACFWLLTFLLKRWQVDSYWITFCESIELSLIAVFCLVILFRSETLEVIFPLLLFLPFVFSHSFDIKTLPCGLICALLIIILGTFIHALLYPRSIVKGKLRYGIIALGISFASGGIFYFSEQWSVQLLAGILLAVVLILYYYYFRTYVPSVKFHDIAWIFCALSGILIFQELIYYISSGNIAIALSQKKLFLGWGRGNNLALILLFTLPFALYYLYQAKNKKQSILATIHLMFQLTGIFVSYSRGSILIITIAMILIIFLHFWFLRSNPSRLLLPLLVGGIYLILFIAILIWIDCGRNLIFPSIKKLLFDGFHIGSLNGRKNIYLAYIRQFLQRPIFGYGLFYPFQSHVDVGPQAYQWSHNTFLHAAISAGTIGLGVMIFHTFEKYYGCLKQINTERWILFLAFFLSGCYGFFDVSYYYINYMAVIFVAWILGDDYLSSMPYDPVKRNQ